VSQNKIGVSQRRGFASTKVASWAGHGPRAPRTNANNPTLVHLGNTSTTCADFNHVDDWYADWQPASRLKLVNPSHFEFVLFVKSAIAHNRPFGGRATHIK